jgi:hypothetical protein
MYKQELPINNPAERLYVILSRAAKSPKQSSIINVLCRAMELEVSEVNFIKGYSELLILLEKTEEQIQQHYSNRKRSLYSRAIQEIKESILSIIRLAHTSSSRWLNVGNLSNPNWIHLESLSTCLEEFEEREIIFNQDLLNELINDVDIWMKEINESQLDEDIKQFFIHKLIEIKYLLEKYYYHGSSRIKTQIYATMVEIGLYQENLTEDKKEENKNFFQMCYDKLSKLSTSINPLMTTAVNADKLLPAISQTAELIGHTVKQFLLPGS